MQREVIKWLQSLDLSAPVRNPRRDLSNGAIAAEIVSRYADTSIIRMQAIGTGNSSEERRNNWAAVYAALKKLHCTTVKAETIEAVLRLQPNAAQAVLEDMYELFTNRTLPVRTLDVVNIIPQTGGSHQASLRSPKSAPSTTRVGGSSATRPAHFSRSQPAGRPTGEVQRFLGPKDTAPIAALLEATGEVPEGSLHTTDKTSPPPAATNMRQIGAGLPTTILLSDDDMSPEDQEHADLAVARVVQQRLAQTRNEELSGGISLFQQPRYSHPTASTLLHSVNNNRYDVALSREKFTDDEVTSVRRNAKIMTQHEKVQEQVKAKVVEIPRRGARKERRPSLTLTAVLRGPFSRHAVTFKRKKAKPKTDEEGVDSSLTNDQTISRKIELNVLSRSLRNALERHGVYLHSDERACEKSVELFCSCHWILRDAFSVLLKDILAAHNDLFTLVELCGNHSEGSVMEDLFSGVVAHRDDLSEGTVRDCWTALEQNTMGIAAALHAKPEQYSYLMQVLSYVFTLEAAQVAIMHVTSSSTDAGGEENQWGNTYLSGAKKFSKTMADGAEDPLPPDQKTVRSDRLALHQARAFVFLGAVGEGLVNYCAKVGNTHVQATVIREYFLPAAKSVLLAYGTPAVLEAVSRIVVSTLTCPTAENQENEQNTLAHFLRNDLMDLWNGVQPQHSLLATAPTSNPGATPFSKGQQGTPVGIHKNRQELFAYHILQQFHQLHTSVPSTESKASTGSHLTSSTLIDYMTEMANRCLSSDNSQSRTVGVSLVVILEAQSCWPEVLELIRVHMPLHNPVAFIKPSDPWELRVVTLYFLCLLSQDTAFHMAESAENLNALETLRQVAGCAAEEDACITEERAAAVAAHTARILEIHKIVNALPLSRLEDGIVYLLQTFRAAPEVHKQLVLSVVSRTLLSCGQPRVVDVWLRSLVSVKPETFRRCVLPSEDFPVPQPPDPNSNTFPSSDETMASSRRSAPNVSSIHLLTGRVESVYIVSPLNQVWNTSSVVLVVLQNLDYLTPAQTLTIIAAALMSPQPVHLQSEELLHNLHLARHSPKEKLENFEKMVTLHDLVLAIPRETLGDGLEADDELMLIADAETTTAGFWGGVLRFLQPILSAALGIPSPTAGRGRKSAGTAESSTPQTDGASQGTLREAAAAVLYALFRRCAPADVVEKVAAVRQPIEAVRFILAWASTERTQPY